MADEIEVVETPEEHQAAVDASVESIASSLKLIPDEGTDKVTGEPAIQEARDRDPFASVPQSKEAPAATEEPVPAAAEPAKPAEPTTEPVVEDRPPDTWRKEAQEAWKNTPKEVKEELAKREADLAKFAADTKKYTEDITPYVTAGTAITKIMEPYMPLLQRSGVTPSQHIQRLLYAHTQLTFGPPEQKVAMFKQMAADAGIDIGALASGQGTAENPMLPLVRGLQDDIAQLRQGVTGVASTFREAQAAELAQGVVAFANDKENHPFWAEVVDQIPGIIDAGQARNLKEAYELAVERNPVTRAALRDKEYADRRAKESAQANEKAAAARKALGSNVRSRGTGRAAPALGTVDDTLKETMAKINARH